jgi:hypothetical protein
LRRIEAQVHDPQVTAAHSSVAAAWMSETASVDPSRAC